MHEADEPGDIEIREDATFFKVRVDKDEDNFPSSGDESDSEAQENTQTNEQTGESRDNSSRPAEVEGNLTSKGSASTLGNDLDDDYRPKYSYKDVQQMLFEDEDLWEKINQKRAQMKASQSKNSATTDTSACTGSDGNSNLIVVTSPSDGGHKAKPEASDFNYEVQSIEHN